jgi:hypothetical protein
VIWDHSLRLLNDIIAHLNAELYDKQLTKIIYLMRLIFVPQREKYKIEQALSPYIFFYVKPLMKFVLKFCFQVLSWRIIFCQGTISIFK